MWPFIDHIQVAGAGAAAALNMCVQKARSFSGSTGAEGGYESVFGGNHEDDQLRSTL